MELAAVIISPNMIRLLLVFGTLVVFSCNNPKGLNLADALKSNCFWDKTDESGVIGGLNSCYKFLPGGQCFFYYYNFHNRKRSNSVFRFDDDDVIVPTAWSITGDTLLIARGTHYKVLSFTKNAVIVEGYLKDTMIFRKNCKTTLER